MNTIKYYFLLGAIAVTALSCDDFLDRDPIDSITSEQYFTNENSVTSALTGAYRTLTSANYYGRAMMIVPELSAKQVVSIQQYPEYLVFLRDSINIDNPWTLNIWTTSYNTINAVNNVLALQDGGIRAGEVTFTSDSTREGLMQEAKFLRALVYFNLVRSFGDVPLVLEPTTPNTDLNVSRTPAEQVYDQIVSDLQMPKADVLPTRYSAVGDGARVTRYAVEALLAKVYLYRGEYALAAEKSLDVIQNGGYSLVDSYGSNWTTRNSSESIFEMQYDAALQNELAKNTAQQAGIFASSQAVYDSFDVADQRRDVNVIKVAGAEKDSYYIGKYKGAATVQNIPVLRLAEVYLIYAEAKARSVMALDADAYNYYKDIRDRAGLTTPETPVYTGTSDQILAQFIADVQREKRRELMYEGEAWYDYTRTGLALTEMMVKPDEGRFLYPIPQPERDLNPNLGQNSAYQN